VTKKFLRNNTGAEEQLRSRIPLDRLGEPSECAGMFLYLASDLASYVSGTTLGEWVLCVEGKLRWDSVRWGDGKGGAFAFSSGFAAKSGQI
jgi:NAD(P)-dependent dehydrogenase (short-subunit alcohol dehydrogenase family)